MQQTNGEKDGTGSSDLEAMLPGLLLWWWGAPPCGGGVGWGGGGGGCQVYRGQGDCCEGGKRQVAGTAS